MIVDCYSHGVDRNPRYEPREEEPGETNPDRKCARDRLPRYEIAITNREAGDEGEINRVADRSALDKANHQTQGNLNRQNCRQHRPRRMNGVAEGYEKAPPHALWCPTVHAYSYGRFMLTTRAGLRSGGRFSKQQISRASDPAAKHFHDLPSANRVRLMSAWGRCGHLLWST